MKKRDLEKEFEEKYDRYGNMLYKIAFLYLNSASDAEDVLQDVFSKYLFSKKVFDDCEYEKAWFIRVTQNNCLDKLKKAERKNIDIAELSLPQQSDDDISQDIISSILALPPKYKTAVVLYYYEGYSVNEIAGILKISRSAVKKRLQRSRDILKIELEDYAP